METTSETAELDMDAFASFVVSMGFMRRITPEGISVSTFTTHYLHYVVKATRNLLFKNANLD
jgi:hypothetical protein